MFVWILSGGGFGIFMAWGVQYWVKKTGDFKYYDWACKITLLIGVFGFLVAGFLVQFNENNFGAVSISLFSLFLLFL